MKATALTVLLLVLALVPAIAAASTEPEAQPTQGWDIFDIFRMSPEQFVSGVSGSE